MVSSSARILGGWRLNGTASSLIAPPFHRSSRSARPAVSSRWTLTVTTPSRVRSSCLRSLSVVAGAVHACSRLSPRARWRRVRRRSGSWAGPAHGGQVRHWRRRVVPARSPIRFPGPGRPAGFRDPPTGSGVQPWSRRSGPARAGGATGPARCRSRLRAAGPRPGMPGAPLAPARPGTRRSRPRRSPNRRRAGVVFRVRRSSRYLSRCKVAGVDLAGPSQDTASLRPQIPQLARPCS
jgi:hypothetical protein